MLDRKEALCYCANRKVQSAERPMVPPRGRPSPVQGTVGGAGLHRGCTWASLSSYDFDRY
jgi:hypothetical protein